MARDQPFSLPKHRHAPYPNGGAGGSRRPSAFERFPAATRNEWINEMQAKIQGVLNPPSPPGPSRSPSPIDNFVTESQEGSIEGAESLDGEEDELEQEDEGEVDDDESLEMDDPLDERIVYDDGPMEDDEEEEGYGSDLQDTGIQEIGSDQEEYDDDDDEDDEEIENMDDESAQQHIALPGSHQRLEDEGGDDFREGIMDSQLSGQWAGSDAEGEYDESEDLEDDEDEEEGDDLDEQEDDAPRSIIGDVDEVVYVGDSDEEEDDDAEEEEDEGTHEEDDGQFDEQEAELDDDEERMDNEEDELVGDEVGLPSQAEPLSVIREVPEQQVPLDTIFDTAQEVQTVLDNLPSQSLPILQPQFEQDSTTSQHPALSLPTESLYPTVPNFVLPTWQTPPAEPAPAPDNTVSTDMIDPSLLADFAQRVEAQASGDMGNTTESQNTEEMTALAHAVMDQYNDDSGQTSDLAEQLREDAEAERFQHGMGEEENDGYAEDHESDNSSGRGDALVEQERPLTSSLPTQAIARSSDGGGDGSDDDESDEDDDSASPSASPSIRNTQEDPIEVLSSDEEEEEESDDNKAEDNQDETDEEEEEEEQVELDRPSGTGSHIRFDRDMSDVLTPPRTASRSSVQTHSSSQPISPIARPFPPNVVDDVDELEEEEEVEEEEEGEEDASKEEAQVSPSIAEPAFLEPTAIPSMNPIAPATSEPALTATEQETAPEQEEDPGLVININETIDEATISEEPASEQVPEVTIMDFTENMEVDVSYEVEEPISRGPSVPLITPAVELPLEAAFPTPEAGFDAIMRVLVAQPDVVEEIIHESENLIDDVDTAGDEPVEMVSEFEVLEVEAPVEAPVQEETLTEPNLEAVASTDEEIRPAPADEEVEEMNPDDDIALLPVARSSPAPIAADDFATIESVTESLPNPHAEPVETDLIIPDVPHHRSRTPSLIVETPANPPDPRIVIDRPVDEDQPPSPITMPDPSEPVPDTNIMPPLSPRDMRPDLERTQSLLVNVQEVDMMLDIEPGAGEDREDREGTPVDFPEPDQPAPETDLPGPIEPEDLSPRDEPRSVSMEAHAPGEAPVMTGTVNSREESPVLFPAPEEPAPNTFIPSPLDVRRDLPMEVEGASETAPSLIVEPPSEPVTGPSSPVEADEEENDDSDLLGPPDITAKQTESEDLDTVPTSSSIDVPSAPLRAYTPPSEAGPSSTEKIRFPSPLRHHHGTAPRQTSVPPATRTTRHTRRSSAATEALHPPVTRQNCHYRKLYMAQDDMSATVLVPQCTLSDREKLEEELAEDRGDATSAEEAKARHQPTCESTPLLQTALTAKLHRIVGSDIFDEAQKTYLLQANDAALLPQQDDKVSGNTSRASAPPSVSPLKPRRSKRLSEAPSESSIKEETSGLGGVHKSGASARTASPVPEETGVEVEYKGGHDLRSTSEGLETTTDEIKPDVEDIDEDETEPEIIIAQDAVDEEETEDEEKTPSPVEHDDAPLPSSKRYSLRSRDLDAEASGDVTSNDRATTPTPDLEVTTASQTITSPMTTRRRARETTSTLEPAQGISMSPVKRSPRLSRADNGDEEPEAEAEAEPSTPKSILKKSKGKGKGRQEDLKYVFEEEQDQDEDEDIQASGTESSTDIIPFEQTSTGRKKRKLRMSVSSNGMNQSPWQLERQGNEEGTPSRGKSKRRAVESKESGVPVPLVEEEGGEEGEERAPLPPPKGWMSYIWPFKR